MTGLESFTLPVQSKYSKEKLDFGKSLNVEIPRHCNMIKSMTLVIDLPGFVSETEHAWVSDVGAKLLKSCKLMIGGCLVDHVTGFSLQQESSLFGVDEKYDELIGNVPELVTPSRQKEPYRLSIPLRFWSTDGKPVPIPLLCLDYHVVALDIELTHLHKLIDLTDLHIKNAQLVLDGLDIQPTSQEYSERKLECSVNQTSQYKQTITYNSESVGIELKLPSAYVSWRYEYADGSGIPVVKEVSVKADDKILEHNKNFPGVIPQDTYAVRLDNYTGSIQINTTFESADKVIVLRAYAKNNNTFRCMNGLGGMAYA